MARKTYSEEFRRDAVELYRSTPTATATVAGIASDLGIMDTTLSNWLKAAGVPIRGQSRPRPQAPPGDETPEQELAAEEAAEDALAVSYAAELARFGIRVVGVAPGIFGTPMMAGLPQEAQDSLGESVPFPKRLGEPREFAALVMHCIHNGYLNGEVIRLDGALRMAPR